MSLEATYDPVGNLDGARKCVGHSSNVQRQDDERTGKKIQKEERSKFLMIMRGKTNDRVSKTEKKIVGRCAN